jgi:acyl dehydratase
MATELGRDGGRTRPEVAVGDQLPPFEIVITVQRLVMEAGANRDFSQIHFEPVAARETGAPDVYANTIFLESVLEACVRAWAGPDAWIEEIAFTMKQFNCIGDRIAARGVVREWDEAADRATVEAWIESDRGRTVEGTIVVHWAGVPAGVAAA